MVPLPPLQSAIFEALKDTGTQFVLDNGERIKDYVEAYARSNLDTFMEGAEEKFNAFIAETRDNFDAFANDAKEKFGAVIADMKNSLDTFANEIKEKFAPFETQDNDQTESTEEQAGQNQETPNGVASGAAMNSTALAGVEASGHQAEISNYLSASDLLGNQSGISDYTSTDAIDGTAASNGQDPGMGM